MCHSLHAEDKSSTFNLKTMLRDHGENLQSETSTKKDTGRQGEGQGAEISTLFLGRLWRWRGWALLARFAFIVYQALPHKVLVIFNVFIKALKLADLEGQDPHQHNNHQ